MSFRARPTSAPIALLAHVAPMAVMVIAFVAPASADVPGGAPLVAQAQPGPCGDKPCDQVPVDQGPCGDTPCAEVPVDEGPCGDKPCDHVPVDQGPCGDKPCGEVPAGEVNKPPAVAGEPGATETSVAAPTDTISPVQPEGAGDGERPEGDGEASRDLGDAEKTGSSGSAVLPVVLVGLAALAVFWVVRRSRSRAGGEDETPVT